MDDKKRRPVLLNSHLAGLRNLSNSLHKARLTEFALSEEARKILDENAKVIASVQKLTLPIIRQQEQFARITRSFQIPKIEIDPGVLRVIREAQESLSTSILPVMEKIRHDFELLPARTQKALLLLGEHGWYLDLKMTIPSLWRLSEIMERGDVDAAEEFLIEHFEERLPEILSEIARKIPARSHLIEAAFHGHSAGQYALSIPVLLAQADGICKDAFDGYYFMKGKDKTKPETAAFVEQVSAETFRAALLSPLAVGLPIAASKKNRDPASRTLNRHAVMHGESLDYGNRVNGLKAISLVNYVSQMVTAENL